MDSRNPPPTDTAPVVRAYQPGDEGAINAAFNDVFAQRRTLDEWRWKFAPDTGRSQIELVVDPATGEVLAQFAVLRVPFRVGGRVCAACQSVDDFCRRRSDLALNKTYVRLARRFHETHGGPGRLDFIYGFPGRRHLRLLLHQGGYEEPVEVPHLERPAGGWSLPRPGWRVEPLEEGGALDVLYPRATARHGGGIVRDGAWLRTRFLSHPDGPYLSRCVWRGGAPAAWAVWRPRGDELVWADLLWDGADPAALRALVRAADAEARRRGLARHTLWLHGDDLTAGALAALGWRARPNPLDLAATARHYVADLPPRLLPMSYFNLADSDLI